MTTEAAAPWPASITADENAVGALGEVSSCTDWNKRLVPTGEQAAAAHSFRTHPQSRSDLLNRLEIRGMVVQGLIPIHKARSWNSSEY